MNNNEFTLISIGKCGGNTTNSVLRSLGYRIRLYHIEKPKYNPTKKYIILIRNPISRIISAFNWRYHIICTTKKQLDRFPGEKELLERYKTVNSFAEDIYNPDGSKKKFYIHHIYEDINFYMGKFLDICKPEDIHGIIMTETIEDDLKRLFNFDKELPHRLKNKKYDTSLSELGRSNLKKYLKKDYKCIEKLYKMNLLTQAQYDILSV